MSRILVTGGAGYIGSHTCIALQNAGHEVVVVDNLCNSDSLVIDRIGQITGQCPKLYQLDLCDKMSLQRIFEEYLFDAVIHFAGLKAVNESISQPLRYYRNNVDASMALLEVMGDFHVYNLVFSSSANVYGAPEDLPVKESSPRHATNPYGRTKQVIEDILTDLHASDRRWNITLLRYFNPVGAHESGLLGEDPKGEPNNLMPFISRVALGRMTSLNVYGGDYPTLDGTGVRDFVHVMDLAEGHVSSLKRMGSSSGLSVYNLGTGNGHSVLEMIAAYERASKRTIPFNLVARREGDVAASYADPSLAQVELGWKAKRDLQKMCVDEWRWQSSQSSISDQF